MPQTPSVGWTLILLGSMLVGLGALYLWGPNVSWFGRLPGDISIERERFRFYFPLVSCLLVSLVFPLVFALIQWLRR